MKCKLYLIALLAMLLCAAPDMCAKKNDNKNKGLAYEVKCAGTPQQGFYLVEVTAYFPKKKDINMDGIKKDAVHAVIFSGFSGEQGCKAQKPILSAASEYQHADFFNAFFQNDYMRFASAVDKNYSVMKVGDRYTATAIIQVAKDELREYLEQAGMVRKLGF